ncbi:uncharacterized protein LOC131182882 [Hevea brasiliensis]|uniref:uncharacterized protein LOC131182882 n=1 Tax=Hevea brasiliensis TaxID=3981 RepID=UPI0025F18FCA|nr:uncharacterized protein LOC131182882 [Hevea brasiliensis]
MRAKCNILAFMTNELQKQHEKIQSISKILDHLQELYGKHTKNVRYEISKQPFRMKMNEWIDVGTLLRKMIRLIEQLEALNFTMDFTLQTDLILQSLTQSFGSFITNFHITKQECTLDGLLILLVIAYDNMSSNKGKEVALIASSSRKSKKKKSNKGKKTFTPGPFGIIAKNQSQKKMKVEAVIDKGKFYLQIASSESLEARMLDFVLVEHLLQVKAP